MRHVVLIPLVLVAAFVAGCSCSSGTTPGTDANVGAADTCTPMLDSPMRGSACASTAECPSGYTCRPSFTTATTCEVSCTPASAACVCATGLRCEVPAGMATGICS